MAAILVLGAGVMGSAIAVPAADNGHLVRLVGTPLDGAAVAALRRPGGAHPKLDAPLPPQVEPLGIDELSPAHFAEADAVIVGVSSRGLDWATGVLAEHLKKPCPVAFVTKGLAAAANDGLKTYADTVPERLGAALRFVGIGGPCIARELANRWPTASVYASRDAAAADALIGLVQTSYYRLSRSGDAVGVEACAALKNFFAIGVSAMQSRWPDRARAGSHAKNPLAAVFNQAAQEMAALCEALGGQRGTAFDLAGMGDLHVTVGGGRNSRLGQGLGQGRRVSEVLAGELAGETVEGADTARALAPRLRGGDLTPARLPLAHAIVDAVLDDRPFEFDFLRIGSPAAAA